MKTIWVVVADEAIARILSWPEVGDELEPVEELTDPAAHAKGSDLRDDARGRRAGNDGTAAGHKLRGASSATAGAGLDEKHQEAEAFARRVALHLAQAQQQQRFDELLLVAAPRFLGLLRKAIAKPVAAAVTESLDKDLIHDSNRDLTQRLFPRGNPHMQSARISP